MYILGFDEKRSLRNLKFCFEIEISSKYKVSILVGSFTFSPGGKYLLGMTIFKDWYTSKELGSTYKTNG